MYRTRVKICGITRAQDVETVQQQGADAMGLVFYEPSPRYVTDALAADLSQVAGPFLNVVGLFVNAPKARVEQVMQRVTLDLLQFHGDETAEYCDSFAVPYIKVFRMKPGLDLAAAMAAYPNAKGFLLDSYQANVPGGTGQSFDWHEFPQHSNRPVILAGGLKPANVAQAIQLAKPFAVDVSGGVESAKGIKDKVLIEHFMEEVLSAK